MKNLVVDAGFLVALWNPLDRHHDWAVATARANPPPWAVCEAVFAEVDHLLGSAGRTTLRTGARRGALRLLSVLAAETNAILDLQDKYSDLPMSVADACVVRLTEILPDALVLATDADFKIYRRHSRKIVPCLLP
ncbi:MAG TPA: PIN domain-containing protein [Chthoniobacterales bacterium]